MLTLTDPWLNIDPTDEDSWTFRVPVGIDSEAYAITAYQVFDENGSVSQVDLVSNTDSGLTDQLGNLMSEHRLSFNYQC